MSEVKRDVMFGTERARLRVLFMKIHLDPLENPLVYLYAERKNVHLLTSVLKSLYNSKHDVGITILEAEDGILAHLRYS